MAFKRSSNSAGGLQAAFDSGTPAQKAAFQSSVSGVDAIVIPASGVPSVSTQNRPLGYRANAAAMTNEAGVISAGAGAGQRAWYLEASVPRGVRYMASTFSFVAGTGGKNGNLALIPWDGPVTASTNVPPTSLHFTINRWTWAITRLEVVNGSMIAVAGGQLQYVLSAGVRYRVEICAIGDVVYICLPDGTTQIVRHEAFKRRPGTHACVEFYQFDGATDDFVQVHDFDFGDDGRQGAQAAALIDAPLSPSYAAITSIASTSVPSAEADVDAALSLAIRVTKAKPRGILRFSAWLNIAAGQSIIFCPRFVRPSGAVSAQPYSYMLTSRIAGEMLYSVDIPMDLFSATDPLTVVPRWFCTAAGGTVTVAGNRPMLLAWFPAI